ncbi:MAG: aminodeoxychorismate synthase component I [Sphingomonadales bacterium]|nr:aminodeoxychorismate synthase component I [Sphingomonadales bacterium]MDE2567753.1 aminodeoxychorismate synthase component I [Sphingomonadales bacterium]
MRPPFILLDDARTEGASDARLYLDPRAIVVARRPDEVAGALARIGADGGHWAGYFAYEAGLALEGRLAPRTPGRTGASGPLVWFARFDGYETLAPTEVPAWLAREGGGGPARLGPMDPQLSPGGYARAFDTLAGAIRAGDIYQVNLTFPLQGAYTGDPLALYAAIRADAGAGYGGVVWDGSHWQLSFSPELFFALKDGVATVRPMKGTAARGRTDEEDEALRERLAANPKDRAENLMIVDLMRNDLSRVSRAGSVRVESPFAVETYPTVHQMVTTVRATLREGEDARSLVRAILPCGSITGAPKIRAMELIDSVERDARGLYCGALGRIDPTGDAGFNVAIRTLRLDPQGGRARMGVGSALVADSDCLGEWRECLLKGNFLRLAAGQADLIETMAFDPARGIPLLEMHLERMKASAAELGFEFDRHAIRNAIQALCFDLDTPSKVRLVASKSGAHALEVAPLPAPLGRDAVCAVLPLPVAGTDWRLRHKTSDRGFHSEALAAAKTAGADEALLLRDDGQLTEGSYTSLFVERGGKLVTPPLALGLLPGVLRRSLIEDGRAVEGEVRLEDLDGGFLIGNALRGLIPARLLTR